jgi:cell division transport system permease protein
VFAVAGLYFVVQVVIGGWLRNSVNWLGFVSTADLLALAPLMIGLALVLAIGSSFVTLARHARV